MSSSKDIGEQSRVVDFLKINESLKILFSDYQNSRKLNMSLFNELHNCLVKNIEGLIEFEDILIRLQNAYNKVNEDNDFSYLISHPDSYHNCLWILHKRMLKKRQGIQNFPENVRKFIELIDTNEFYVFTNEKGGCEIHFSMGVAIGHYAVLFFDDKIIKFECSDHSPSRIVVFKERLEKIGFQCSNITVFKSFKKEEGSMNYIFFSTKEFNEFDLNNLAVEINLQKDLDWFLCDQMFPYEEAIQAEINFLRFAYFLYDQYKIQPIKVLKWFMAIPNLKKRMINQN